MEQVTVLTKQELLNLKIGDLLTLLEKTDSLPESEEKRKFSKLISKVIAIKGDDLLQ